MKQVKTILRAILISPELLVTVIGAGLCYFWPEWFIWLSRRIGQEAELLKYIGLLPAGLVAYDLTITKDVLLPAADKRNILQGWPRYHEFKATVFSGIFYACIFAVGGIAALLFDWKAPAPYQSAVLVIALAGSLTVAATLFNAHIKMEEVFRENGKPPPE